MPWRHCKVWKRRNKPWWKSQSWRSNSPASFWDMRPKMSTMLLLLLRMQHLLLLLLLRLLLARNNNNSIIIRHHHHHHQHCNSSPFWARPCRVECVNTPFVKTTLFGSAEPVRPTKPVSFVTPAFRNPNTKGMTLIFITPRRGVAVIAAIRMVNKNNTVMCSVLLLLCDVYYDVIVPFIHIFWSSVSSITATHVSAFAFFSFDK